MLTSPSRFLMLLLSRLGAFSSLWNTSRNSLTDAEPPSAKMARRILRFRPYGALPPAMYRKIKLFSSIPRRASSFGVFVLCLLRSFQSSSRTSHMNCSHICHLAHRSGCRTEQLNAHPTACQKSSARDQRDPDWHRSMFSVLVSSWETSPFAFPSSSPRRRLPCREDSK